MRETELREALLCKLKDILGRWLKMSGGDTIIRLDETDYDAFVEEVVDAVLGTLKEKEVLR
jgi:hypothetical protein